LKSEDEETVDARRSVSSRTHAQTQQFASAMTKGKSVRSAVSPTPAATGTVRASSAMRARQVEEILAKGPSSSSVSHSLSRSQSTSRVRPTSILPTNDPSHVKGLPAAIASVVNKGSNASNGGGGGAAAGVSTSTSMTGLKKMLQRVPPQPPGAINTSASASSSAASSRSVR
jgi:hypothetical protein